MQTFQALLGTEPPIIQALIAGSQASRLALAVCGAGGLGSLPVATLGAEGMVRELNAIRSGTDRPFNVNFFCHTPPTPDAERVAQWRGRLAHYHAELGVDDAAPLASKPREPYSEALAALLETFAPPVVSFHFGLPTSDQVARIKGWGAKVISSATTVDEARWLEAERHQRPAGARNLEPAYARHRAHGRGRSRFPLGRGCALRLACEGRGFVQRRLLAVMGRAARDRRPRCQCCCLDPATRGQRSMTCNGELL
jgi:hypothetical protein